ncbi:MAG: DUF1987 domain-containing protein [Flavobacteriales bacterium]
MQALIIPASSNTPGIWFEPGSATFELTGNSIPENASEFYQPVMGWLANHLHLLDGEQILRIKLSYFNSTSLKALYMMLKLVKDANAMGSNMRVEWHIEEDDELLMETQAMLSEMLGMPMEVIACGDRGAKREAI